ncbi:MAG: HAD hydrolase-like protein, partial [Acidimicrobiales bacterium]
PYFVGKPNPIMIRDALDRISAEAHDSVMVGDRMETDVIAGIEAGLATVLVLSGVTALDDLRHFAYQPDRVVDSVADLLADLA